VPSNASLINLLPFAPALNPVENLCRDLRADYGSNGVYRDYGALLPVATQTWRQACMDPGEDSIHLRRPLSGQARIIRLIRIGPRPVRLRDVSVAANHRATFAATGTLCPRRPPR
jgi:hypothetical protein